MTQDITTVAGQTPRPELDLWSPENARSVFNLVPAAVRNAFLAAKESDPTLFTMEERQLRLNLQGKKRNPTPLDNRLRVKFWAEYENTQDHLTASLSMAAVTSGLCTREYFYSYFLASPEKVAWLLCPPANYGTMMEEALLMGIEQMRDILEMPNILPNGAANVKLMELKAKIVGMLDIRVKGAIVQKVEQKNLSVSLHGTAKGVEAIAQLSSMEEIQKRMADLEKRERRALNLPEPGKPDIEVEKV